MPKPPPLLPSLFAAVPRSTRHALIYSLSRWVAPRAKARTALTDGAQRRNAQPLLVAQLSSPQSLGHVARLLARTFDRQQASNTVDLLPPPRGLDVSAFLPGYKAALAVPPELPDVRDNTDTFNTTARNSDKRRLIWATSANLVPYLSLRIPRSLVRSAHSTGYLVYEFEEMPQNWRYGLHAFHDIVACSPFVARAVAASGFSGPVRVAPYPLGQDLPPRPAPDAFTSGPLIVLHSSNLSSDPERKNAAAVVAAFVGAFNDDGRADSPRLKLHLNAPDTAPEYVARLQTTVAGRRDITLSLGTLPRAAYLAWWRDGALFCSLHRAEGFGLGLAEAMASGRAAMATNWSGNLAFMDADTSLLTRYCLVDAPRRFAYGDRRVRLRWAEPSLDHAIEQLRWARDNRSALGEMAKRGQARALAVCAPRHTLAAFDRE